MSIKVVELQNEEAKELPPIEEEPKEEVIETPVVNEVVEENNEETKEETAHGSLNSNPVGVETKEEPKEEAKPKPLSQSESAGGQRPLPKAKPKASDIVPCPDCNKSMTYKNLRYSHKCSPEPKPVKPQAKPKAKQQPKPKPPPEIYYSDEEEEHKPLSKPVKNQILKPRSAGAQSALPQPITPASALAQHYQLLQQQFIKQKQEKYNNLCMNMFSSKSKKRN